MRELNEEEHKKYHIKLLYITLVIIIVLFIGTIFYHYIEGWSYLDSLYFSAATITTVGYGDFTPRTDLGKLFTIFYIFIGVGIALYGLSVIVSHFVETKERFNVVRRIFRKREKVTSSLKS
ncbi:two pore domain potassium channel family protein [Candidatus Pacearchaeota archaeon]|nr:two pore domain potassium channel family protein [Candidatus Pacearchaeota archaeon]